LGRKVFDIYSPDITPHYTGDWSTSGSSTSESSTGGELKRGKLKKIECEEVIKSYELKENICGVFDSEGDIPVLYYSKGMYSRKAFLEKPVEINGKPYIIEIKGVGDRGEKINLSRLRTIGIGWFPQGDTGPVGGLPLSEGINSARITKKLNERGIDNPLFIALYKLPLTYRDLYGKEQPLSIEIRATDSTLRASWFVSPFFRECFLKLLNVDPQDYARFFSKKTLNAYKSLLEEGYIFKPMLKICKSADEISIDLSTCKMEAVKSNLENPKDLSLNDLVANLIISNKYALTVYIPLIQEMKKSLKGCDTKNLYTVHFLSHYMIYYPLQDRGEFFVEKCLNSPIFKTEEERRNCLINLLEAEKKASEYYMNLNWDGNVEICSKNLKKKCSSRARS
jgi:hypothetical protein